MVCYGDGDVMEIFNKAHEQERFQNSTVLSFDDKFCQAIFHRFNGINFTLFRPCGRCEFLEQRTSI